MAIKIYSAATVPGDKAKAKNVGIAFADTSLRELGVADFVDNDLFSNTEVCASRLALQPVNLYLSTVSHYSTFCQRGYSAHWNCFGYH